MLFLGMLTENQSQITRLLKATRKWLACEEQLSHLDELTLETPSVGGEHPRSLRSDSVC